MSKFIINGGKKLYGKIDIQSAKNSVVSLLAASILYNGNVVLRNIKQITDVTNMCNILKKLGAVYDFKGDNLFLNCSSLYSFVPNVDLSKTIRASFFMAGALLSRFKKAEMSFPGGCKIGARPINIHLQGFKQLGVKIKVENSKIYFDGSKMHSAVIELPYPSVGATVNIITASVFLDGETIIKNVAKEPEIVDLQNFLNLMGFNVRGAGKDEISVHGVKKILSRDIYFTPIVDRIETGTFMLATLSCGGEIEINNTNIKNIYSLYEKIYENNCKMFVENGKIIVYAGGGGKSLGEITTGPFPAFPTDLQAPLCAYACSLKGQTTINESVFEKRFSHVDELVKMGAVIKTDEKRVFVYGSRLQGAKVQVGDLRAGAGLVIAGLLANGTTEIEDVEIIDRGYFEIENVFSSLGASIYRV